MDRMRNRYLDVLTAILLAGGIIPDAVRAGTPAPRCSRDAGATFSSWATGPPEMENSTLRPAGKVLADVCPSVDVAALAGDDLIDYLRNTSGNCLRLTLHIYDNPSIEGDLPTIFSDRNMQSVLAEIEESAAAYDGTNSNGMLQLWFFVQVGYSYHRFFLEETGVGPFDETTDSTYLAASDAFAASDHFHAPNDEAAQIFFYYFEAAFAAGLRRNHLAPIKQVLSGFTPERAASGSGVFRTVLSRVLGSFQNRDEGIIAHREFHQALEQDTEFVDVMLQVTRFDFFFLDEGSDSFNRLDKLGYLERALRILIRLTWVDSLREQAVAALTSVLSWHERLSSPFLIAARALENQVDCASLNICRDALESEILSQAVPNSYRFDDGAIVFQTSLDLEEVQPWYYALKQVEAQFHRLVETDEVARDYRDVFTARIYGTELDYVLFEAYMTGADTRGIHSGGVYGGGTMSTFVRNRPGDRVQYGVGTFEETVRHEYAHYLADRFGLLSYGGPWFNEGLAEFLVGSTQADGVQLRHVAGGRRLDPAGLFRSEYSGVLGGSHFYDYAALFFHFLHRQRRTQLLELFDLVRGGDYAAYTSLVSSWAGDVRLADDFDSFLDEQSADVPWKQGRPFFTYLPSLAALTGDNAAEIENALQRIDSDLGPECRTVGTEPSPRFGCTGSLAVPTEFDGDRGALNEYLNTRVDSLIAAALEDGTINNFKGMNCYFANLAGSLPVADLYCEGPLRPMDVDRVRPQVDLTAYLYQTKEPGAPKVDEEGSLHFFVGFYFPGEGVASNVSMTWAASLPLRLWFQDGPRRCGIAETNGLTGTLKCGNVRSKGIGFDMLFTPLQAGLLDFSVEFSADEEEIEPADNIAMLRSLAIAPDPNNPPRTLAKLSGDNQEGLPREDLPQPFTVSVLDQNGSAFTGAIVTFAVVSGDGMLSVETAATDTSGRAASTLTLGADPGTNTVRATVAGLEPVVFTATGLGPRTLAKVSGDGQQEAAGAALAEPFVVSVLDQNGSAFPGATVNFAVTSGDGTLSATTATTDANGRAATTLTLGRELGANTVTARVAELDPVTFTATGQAILQSLTRVSGDGQQAAAGAQLTESFVVAVLDQNGDPFPGATVTFSVTAGGGTLSTTTATTDANGHATTTLTLGSQPETNTVTASVADLEPVTFTATAEATPDFDGDGETGFSDFFLFADAFGGSDPRFDLDGSGSVDFGDFFLFADHFGDPARGKLLALAREMIGLPDGPRLQQNAPNPFNSETVISWFQLRPGPANVEVFALTGQRVAVLHQRPKKAGVHRVHWDGRDDRGRPLASGVYLYRLVTNESLQARKLTLLR